MSDKFCKVCQLPFLKGERVIYSAKETFVFKPAHVEDTVNPAAVTSTELRESRKDHLKQEVANHYVDWGVEELAKDAFNFRHIWCEPQRTGGAVGAKGGWKHGIRFTRRLKNG